MSSDTPYGHARDTGYAPAEEKHDISPPESKPPSKIEKDGYEPEYDAAGLEQSATVQEGSSKYKRLSWQRLTICLIVEAIALGSLSIPGAFATLGMVGGVISTVGLGLLAIYTSHVVGQVKLKYPHIEDYAQAVELIWGKFGYALSSTMFVLLLVLIFGSHALTGTIALVNIIDKRDICVLAWSAISAVILFLLALPPSFHEFAILGYIDFVSICAAILTTIIATGVEAHQRPGGLGAVNWSAWPQPGTTFFEGMLSITNIVLAYGFSICQFSFMTEMHTPEDYVKSIWTLGLTEITIYTLTGALIYAFVGVDVQSPALLSAGPTVMRVAFGIALPVIFISGSINGTVVARYVTNNVFRHSTVRYVNTPRGWAVWIGIIAAMTVIAWVIAEAIPFFSDLLGVMGALFNSGFTYYFPALFWFILIKEGKWYSSRRNIVLTLLNGACFIVGVVTLGAGTYASVQSIINEYKSGSVRSPFTCSAANF